MSQEIKICTDASGKFGGGLSATDMIKSCARVEGACIIKSGGTGSQFLKADGSVDSTAYTTCVGTVVAGDISSFTSCTGTVVAGDISTFTSCTGDIEGVTVGPYLTGGGQTGCVEVGIDSACAAAWDAAVAGGITEVTTTSLISGGGSSGSVEIGIDSGALNYLNQSGCPGIDCEGTVTCVNVSDGLESTGGDTPTLGIATACNTKWDQSGCAGIDCTGTVVAGDISSFTSCTGTLVASDISGFTCCEGTLVPADLTACDTKFDQSGCAGLNCVGTVVAGDISSFTDCIGTVTTASTLLSTDGCNIGVDSGALDYLNQSGCAGLDCVGTVVSSDIAGFTCCTGTLVPADLTACDTKFDQSGCAGLDCVGTVVASDISGFTCCEGTVTSVGGTNGIVSTGGTTPSLCIDSACNTKWNNAATGGVQSLTTGTGITDSGTGTDPDIAITSTCDTKWNSAKSIADGLALCAGLGCTGTVTTAGALLSGSATTLGVDSGALDYLNQSACAGIDCVGTLVASDIDGLTCCTGTVVAGDISSFTSCTGTVTSVGGTNGIVSSGGTAPTVCIDSACNTKWNAKTTCIGTVVAGDISSFTGCTGTTTPSSTETFTNKSGSNSQWTNDENYTTCTGTVVAGDISSFTSCTGTVTTASTLLSTDGCNIGVDSDALTYLNQSACAGIDCEGTVTSVGGTNGIVSTGGTTPSLCIDSACNTKWNNAATGGVQSLATSGGITDTGTATDPAIAIDSACNTKWDQSGCAGIDCVGTVVAGDISSFTSCTGTVTTASTLLSTDGCNIGVASGALNYLNQSACAGLLCTGTLVASDLTACNTKFDQSGCAGINCVGTVVAGDISSFTDCVGTVTTASTLLSTDGCSIGVDSGALNYLNQSGCAGILCTGTVVAGDISSFTGCTGTTTPSSTETFTNKSGSNSQWTNDENYTTCTGTVVAGDISSFTGCTGTVTSVGGTNGIESTGGTSPTLCITTACQT